MKHLTDEQLRMLKLKLLAEKAELERHYAINEGVDAPDSGGELSFYDNHPADLGTETFERERDQAVDDALAERLDEIRAALDKMDAGVYGLCAASGEPIPFERLEALPSAATRIEYARAAGNGRIDRPVEEDVMTPPSGAGENRQRHAGRFDDADAWKLAADQGTSSDQGDHPGV